jgi:hypothetical protein
MLSHDYHYATRVQLDNTPCRLAALFREQSVDQEVIQCIRRMHFHSLNLNNWLEAPWSSSWDGLDVLTTTSLLTIMTSHWALGPTGTSARSLDAAVGLALVVFSALALRGRDPVYEPLHFSIIPRLRRHWIEGGLTNRLLGNPIGVWLAVVVAMGAMMSTEEAFFIEQCDVIIESCTLKLENLTNLTALLSEYLWVPLRLNQYVKDVWEKRPS